MNLFKLNPRSILNSTIWVICVLLCFSRPTHAAEASQQCDPSLIKLVGKKLGLAYFSHPRDGMFPSRENAGLLIASACKKMPDVSTKLPTKTIAAFVYDKDPSDDFAKYLFVLVVDHAKKEVVATYKRGLGVDADTEWHRDSLLIDTGAYFLAPKTRAFALRTRSFKDQCMFEGGQDDELSLFVLNEKTLRPILTTHMSAWHYGAVDRCGGKEVSSVDAHTVISLLPTTTNGYADLQLSARFSNQKKAVNAVVKYNGRAYDIKTWQDAFAAWWKSNLFD